MGTVVPACPHVRLWRLLETAETEKKKQLQASITLCSDLV